MPTQQTASAWDALFKALVDEDFSLAARFIEENTAILKSRNDRGLTILDVFSLYNMPDIVDWLCIKLQSLGMSIDLYNEDGFTTTQHAFIHGSAESVKVLLKYTTMPNLKEWFVQRQIICIFGTNFLSKNNFALDENHTISAGAGYVLESTQIMSSAICKFGEDDSRYVGIGKSIFNLNNTTRDQTAGVVKPEELVADIIKRANYSNNPRVLFRGGYEKHAFIAGIKKNNNGSYQLSLYDANEVPKSISNILNVFFLHRSVFVKRINVPAEELPLIIETLIKHTSSPLEDVLSWLRKIPKTLNTSYDYDKNILFDIDKREKNRCYWENVKYAILDLFIDKFGVVDGERNFHNFLALIEAKSLDNFKKTFENRYNPQAINNLEHVARHKKNDASSQYWTPARQNFVKKTVAAMLFITGLVFVATGFGAMLGVPLCISAVSILGVSGAFFTASLGCVFVLTSLFATAKEFKAKVTRYLKSNSKPKIPLVLTQQEAPAFSSSNHKMNMTLSDPASQQKAQECKENFFPVTQSDIPQTAGHSAKLFTLPRQREKATFTSDEALKDLWEVPHIISFG